MSFLIYLHVSYLQKVEYVSIVFASFEIVLNVETLFIV